MNRELPTSNPWNAEKRVVRPAGVENADFKRPKGTQNLYQRRGGKIDKLRTIVANPLIQAGIMHSINITCGWKIVV